MDITSPTVDRSQADGPTATRSQQQKAAAVQTAVAARKRRYLACAFPKLHVGKWRGLVLRTCIRPCMERLCSWPSWIPRDVQRS